MVDVNVYVMRKKISDPEEEMQSLEGVWFLVSSAWLRLSCENYFRARDGHQESLRCVMACGYLQVKHSHKPLSLTYFKAFLMTILENYFKAIFKKPFHSRSHFKETIRIAILQPRI